MIFDGNLTGEDLYDALQNIPKAQHKNFCEALAEEMKFRMAKEVKKQVTQESKMLEIERDFVQSQYRDTCCKFKLAMNELNTIQEQSSLQSMHLQFSGNRFKRDSSMISYNLTPVLEHGRSGVDKENGLRNDITGAYCESRRSSDNSLSFVTVIYKLWHGISFSACHTKCAEKSAKTMTSYQEKNFHRKKK